MNFKIALFLGLCLGLTGCLGGRSADPDFYTLSPTAEKIISDKNITIGLNRIKIARHLDRPQIITQSQKTAQVNISEMNRWIEPLSELIARTLITDMGKALPNSIIKTRSIGQENFDYILSVEIIDMNTVLGETTALNAWWTLYDKDEKMIFRHQTTETTKVGKTYQNLATAQSHLLGKLSNQIALKIANL